MCALLPQASAEIHTLTESTRSRNLADITFYLRMPSGWDEEQPVRDFRRQVSSGVHGVLAICNWSADAEEVKKNLNPDGRFKLLVQWADRHDLAVVTWTNFRGYTTKVSGDELDEYRQKELDRAFEERVREWEKGYGRLCRQYGLPERNLLIYGLSGGAQMAHRLVLRKPEMFFAIHMHVNSSYDVPRREANEVLWLVTTGTLEAGYPAGQRFYQKALDLGFPVIFKAQENLGHSDSAEIRRLGMAFFEFCLPFMPDARDRDWEAPPETLDYFWRYPTHVGDWYNHLVFPADKAEEQIPPEFMVSLPTRKIAEAWGPIVGGN